MTLPSSGVIKLSDIRGELGLGTTFTPFSLSAATDGNGPLGYPAINQASTSKPVATDPDSVSEWYSYYHDAKYAITVYDMTPDITLNPCCGRPTAATVYSNCSTLAVNCYVYTTNGSSSPYLNAFLSDLAASTYYTTNGTNGQINASYGCIC